MTAPSATAYRMTVKDFYELPEGPPYFQLIDGDLYMSPSPRRYHQQISMFLSGVLYPFIEEHDLGEVYAAPSDVMFSNDVILNPDLYFVSREREHILTDQGAHGAPDLVIEILSPSTARLDVGRKREIYAESGVREMWVIAPETCTVEVYRFAENREQPAAVLTVGEAITSPILPGLALAIAGIFKD